MFLVVLKAEKFKIKVPEDSSLASGFLLHTHMGDREVERKREKAPVSCSYGTKTIMGSSLL